MFVEKCVCEANTTVEQCNKLTTILTGSMFLLSSRFIFTPTGTYVTPRLNYSQHRFIIHLPSALNITTRLLLK